MTFFMKLAVVSVQQCFSNQLFSLISGSDLAVRLKITFKLKNVVCKIYHDQKVLIKMYIYRLFVSISGSYLTVRLRLGKSYFTTQKSAIQKRVNPYRPSSKHR